MIEPLDEASVRAVIEALERTEVEAVAVCLLFAFLHPEHEQRVGRALREALPHLQVSLSSEVLPGFREYEHFSTTAADAYLALKLATYLRSLAQRAEQASLPAPRVMQSSGGVTDIGSAAGAATTCVLSGPAGGVVGAAFAAGQSGYRDLLTFRHGRNQHRRGAGSGEVDDGADALLALHRRFDDRLPGVGGRSREARGPTLVCVIEKLVEQIEGRFSELSEQMSDPEVISDQRRYAEAGRAYRSLERAHGLARQWRRATDDAAGARELLAEDGDDPEVREMLRASEERLGELGEEIRLAMVEPDPNDAKDVIVEVRPGAGGEEAGLFAADLYRMLARYAERRGFKTEPIEIGEGHFTFAVKGQGAYSVFKYEGGTHRVQRVPETESQGRIHTSTATVAVLPEAEDVDVHIDQNDLQVDVYRSSGPGGQSVNTTDSAVRITHKPTGVVVSMQDEKSQLQNREKAMRVLRARLLEREMAAQQAEEAAARLAQVGTGERAEKIRTYNFPQDRVTDHRVGLTKGNLPGVLSGELDEFTAALESEEKRRMLEAAEPVGG